jgi:hypothetical protein
MQESNLQPFELKVTHSHPTGAVTNYISGEIAAQVVVSYSTSKRAGSIQNLRHQRSLQHQGKSCAAFTIFGRLKTAAESNRVALWGLPEVSAHCATGAAFFTMRGNDRDAVVSMSQMKYPRPSPLALARKDWLS